MNTSKIAIIIFSRNRPDFLKRTISYYNNNLYKTNHILNIYLMDGSDEEVFEKISKMEILSKNNLNIKIFHHSPKTIYLDRMRKALSLIYEEFVLLAADDDFYFIEWINLGVNFLLKNKDYGLVYGHVLKFKINNFNAFGDIKDIFVVNKRNPPLVWLEDSKMENRFESLNSPGTDWATYGWYALQEKNFFKNIISTAIEYKLDGYSFEKFMIFAQTALRKSKLIDSIYLARQINDFESRSLFSFKKEISSILVLLKTSKKFLEKNKLIDGSKNDLFVDQIYENEIKSLKRNDRWKLVKNFIKKIPFYNKFLYILKIKKSKIFYDKRLAKPPQLNDCLSYITLIKESCKK